MLYVDECSVLNCSGSAPRWSALCDLHRDRLAAGVRLTDGDPMPLRRAIEDRTEERALARELDW